MLVKFAASVSCKLVIVSVAVLLFEESVIVIPDIIAAVLVISIPLSRL